MFDPRRAGTHWPEPVDDQRKPYISEALNFMMNPSATIPARILGGRMPQGVLSTHGGISGVGGLLPVYENPVLVNGITRGYSLAGMLLGGYHGFKRNNSVGWAIGWGILGSIAPSITAGIAVGQGFARRAK